MLLSGEVKGFRPAAEAKASPKRASESEGADAKLCDLSLDRLKFR